jgi:hypothetical protein
MVAGVHPLINVGAHPLIDEGGTEDIPDQGMVQVGCQNPGGNVQ